MTPPNKKKYLAAEHYTLNDFDKYTCLAPGVVLWLVIGFLMRPYLVMAMSFSQRGNRMGTIDLVYPDRIWFAIDALAALPAVVVIGAYIFRKPQAQAVFRKIWRSGRAWLLASSSANALVAVAGLVMTISSRTTLLSPILLCISGWCLWYLIASRRVRDVFGDFPAADQRPE